MNKPKKNALEWLVFGVSTVLVLGTLTVLVISGIRSGDDPPLLDVQAGRAVHIDGGYRLPVTIRNTGGATAEQAVIEVLLLSGEQVVERSELSISFVPRKSSREAWVTFRRDPSCCRVMARASGFNSP